MERWERGGGYRKEVDLELAATSGAGKPYRCCRETRAFYWNGFGLGLRLVRGISKMLFCSSIGRRALFLSAAAAACCGGAGVQAQPTNLAMVQEVGPVFSSPLYVCSPPGDDTRLFVVQQGGLIRLLTRANANAAWSATATTFLDVSSLLTPNTGSVILTACVDSDCNSNTPCVANVTQSYLLGRGGEQGLLGLAFAPDYATSGVFYVNYVAPRGVYSISASCPSAPPRATDVGKTAVSRYRRNVANPNIADTTAEVVFQLDQPFTNHNGGCLQFGSDGFLYIAMGDGGSGNDPLNAALNPNNALGKILRINPTGDAFPADTNRNFSVPAGNPFASGVGGLPEVFIRGMRNPWRFSFDRVTSDLYIADVGQGVIEEVNFIAAGTGAGRNGGWRIREGNAITGLSAGGFDVSNLTAPVYTYTHGSGALQGLSITGGYCYRGRAIPALRGRYFFADFVNARLFSIRMVGGVMTDFQNNYAGLNPAAPATAIVNIASFGEDNQGEMYICQLNGRIRKVVPRAGQPDMRDVNFDGVVDPDDLADFINLYFSGDLRADFNLDDGVDPDDLADYVAAFFG